MTTNDHVRDLAATVGPSEQRAPLRAWLGLGVLVLAVTLLAIDGTVLALAIPSLAADLGATSTELLWVGDVYSLVLAGLLITMGNVADRFGRKKVLLIGATVFGIASAVGAQSPAPATRVASAPAAQARRERLRKARSAPSVPASAGPGGRRCPRRCRTCPREARGSAAPHRGPRCP